MPSSLRLPAAVRVPGSSANLGPGFDVLGLALDIYLTARIAERQAGEPSVRLSGPHTEGIAAGPDNLVLKAFRLAFERAGRTAPEIALELDNRIPLARGLGSSGAAAVAGIALANHCADLRMDRLRVAALASELEGGHPDNVAASVFGGLTVACYTSDASDAPQLVVQSLPWPKDIGLIVAIPECRLETAKARAVLPTSYSRADTVFNLQRVALLAATLASGSRAAAHITAALSDRIHQPYRAPLVPGMQEALELRVPGLLGVVLSGAGPSLLAFVEGDAGATVGALRAIYDGLGIACEVRPVSVAAAGASISSTQDT